MRAWLPMDLTLLLGAPEVDEEPELCSGGGGGDVEAEESNEADA